MQSCYFRLFICFFLLLRRRRAFHNNHFWCRYNQFVITVTRKFCRCACDCDFCSAHYHFYDLSLVFHSCTLTPSLTLQPFEIPCSLWVSCECVLIHRRREKSRQLYIAIYFVQNTSKECLLIEFRLARIIHAISHFSRWNCGYEHHQCFIFFVALSFWGFCFLI